MRFICSTSVVRLTTHRTISGEFIGAFDLTPGFEAVIRYMVKPEVSARAPRCEDVLAMAYFQPEPPVKRKSHRSSSRASSSDFAHRYYIQQIAQASPLLRRLAARRATRSRYSSTPMRRLRRLGLLTSSMALVLSIPALLPLATLSNRSRAMSSTSRRQPNRLRSRVTSSRPSLRHRKRLCRAGCRRPRRSRPVPVPSRCSRVRLRLPFSLCTVLTLAQSESRPHLNALSGYRQARRLSSAKAFDPLHLYDR